jgi:hypothetical protein
MVGDDEPNVCHDEEITRITIVGDESGCLGCWYK